jgi:hypothetical protein
VSYSTGRLWRCGETQQRRSHQFLSCCALARVSGERCNSTQPTSLWECLRLHPGDTATAGDILQHSETICSCGRMADGTGGLEQEFQDPLLKHRLCSAWWNPLTSRGTWEVSLSKRKQLHVPYPCVAQGTSSWAEMPASLRRHFSLFPALA